MTYYQFFIPLAAALIILPAAMFAFGGAGAKRRDKAFAFRSYFPYEMFGASSDPFAITARVFETLTAFASPLIVVYAVMADAPSSSNVAFLCLIGIFLFLFHVSFVVYSSLTLYYPKQHLSFYFAGEASSFLAAGMAGIFFVNAYRYVAEPSMIAFAVVSFIFAVLHVALIVNPKLRDWDRMDKETSPEGTVTYVRPRHSVLALSEWWSYIANCLFSVVALIGFLLISIAAQ
jgi:hypothetical protein